ncbi:hypothetical protein [Sphingomonas phyllosphaerae]|uniref:hypothetical protein n=1 Tax=Sphingomonas phyllosphaerae TaxID=257003 RepID=UPI0012DC7D2A|nr:hypothetical protein [Sphingomonas phyllosphaerae]
MKAEDLDNAKYIQEWVKIFVGVLTPLAIAVLTFFVSRALNDQQANLKRTEQVLLLKQQAYELIGPDLNKIYVYIDDVGDFRNYTPEDIVRFKREADRKFYMYSVFWSKDTNDAYQGFMTASFKTYTGSGENAQIRSFPNEKQEAMRIDGKKWKSEWDRCFTGERDLTIRDKYQKLVKSFIEDITSGAVR